MELKAELQFSAAPLGRFGGPSVLAGGASGAFWVRLDLRIVLLRTFGKRNELFIIVDAQPYTSNNDIGHSNHRNRTTTRRHIHLPFTQGGLRVRTRFGSGGSQGLVEVKGNITAINASQIRGWEATTIIRLRSKSRQVSQQGPVRGRGWTVKIYVVIQTRVMHSTYTCECLFCLIVCWDT